MSLPISGMETKLPGLDNFYLAGQVGETRRQRAAGGNVGAHCHPAAVRRRPAVVSSRNAVCFQLVKDRQQILDHGGSGFQPAGARADQGHIAEQVSVKQDRIGCAADTGQRIS
jgi:hypothetical protein